MITTHALFARKVQRKLSNGVAGFAAGGSSSDRKRSRPIRAFSATPRDGQRRCRTLAEDPGRTQPRAAYPGAAAQTRVVSLAGIRLGSWESAQAFKGIICDNVSEFESYMPSQPVRSPPLLAGGPPKSAQIGPIRHVIPVNATNPVQCTPQNALLAQAWLVLWARSRAPWRPCRLPRERTVASSPWRSLR